VFSVVLAHFFLPDERLSARTALGVGAAVAGACIVVWGGAGVTGVAEDLRGLWLGTVLIIANALSVAVSSVLVRRRLVGEDGLVVTGGQMAVGLLIVTPFALLIEGPPQLAGVPTQGWVALLWAALIGAFLGYAVLFLMIRRWGVTTTAVSSTAVPLVTAIAGTLLLDERLTPLMVVGGLVLVGGVLIVVLGGRMRPGEPSGGLETGRPKTDEVVSGSADSI
jgi:drug/metabolite transporter (DMT)-like permease